MNSNDYKRKLKKEWEAIQVDAYESKYPEYSTFELKERYGKLNPEQRLIANEIIMDWVLSEDGIQQFNAFVLIKNYKIRSAVPRLEAFIENFKKKKGGPEIAEEIRWAKEIIKHLQE